MKKSVEEIQENVERRAEEANRRYQAACELMGNTAFVDFYVRPNKEQASLALGRALAECAKPAGIRNDSLVVECLRDYQVFNEIATAASSLIEQTQKLRRKAEEQALQKERNVQS